MRREQNSKRTWGTKWDYCLFSPKLGGNKDGHDEEEDDEEEDDEEDDDDDDDDDDDEDEDDNDGDDDDDEEEENQRRYDFRQRKTVVRYQAPQDGNCSFLVCSICLILHKNYI